MINVVYVWIQKQPAMKSKLRLLSFATFLLVISTLHYNCYKDINCRNEKVGDIYLEDITKDFFSLDTAKALVFKNENGGEMRFVCKNPVLLRLDLQKELKCIHPNLSYNYKYVNADYWELPYYQDSIYAEVIQMRFTVNTKSTGVVNGDENASFYDSFKAILGFDSSKDFGAAIINFIVSERDSKPEKISDAINKQTFRIIADTIILGNHYTDLIASIPAFGTQPDEHYSLLYQRNFGPVVLSTKDGTVYVFDREE